MTIQFEYQILKADSLVNEKQLNEIGTQGWLLIEIVKHDGLFYFYFKREVYQ